MLIDTLIQLFERDLNRLVTEIELYKNEENIWRVDDSISNSAGNLVLHIVGNLSTYIGKEIGKTNYIRNRELEFSQKNISRQDLIKRLNDTLIVVTSSLMNLSQTQLESEYPILVFTKKTSTEYLLVHLTTHLSYHLGQVNYHRRLLDK
jgi:uncharacterized damage-inducible protein DinB